MNFFFDYIYYRMTKFYFKWDGRTGITAIIGVSMIQSLVILDIFTIILRRNYDRSVTKNYVEEGKWVTITILLSFIIFNYVKYNGKYNKYRSYWKDESYNANLIKGWLVVLSLILPWVPLILIGVYW